MSAVELITRIIRVLATSNGYRCFFSLFFVAFLLCPVQDEQDDPDEQDEGSTADRTTDDWR